jgi:hypothetical protein
VSVSPQNLQYLLAFSQGFSLAAVNSITDGWEMLYSLFLE